MASQYSFLRIALMKVVTSSLERHLTRRETIVDGSGEASVISYFPDNADPDRTSENVCLIEPGDIVIDGRRRQMTVQEAVDSRIRELGIQPRRTVNRCFEVVFSGSHDTMVGMDPKMLLDWARDSIDWASRTWGASNIKAAYLHLDEDTPHIHAVVVPVIQGVPRRTMYNMRKEGTVAVPEDIAKLPYRLSAADVLTSTKLRKCQDSYAEEVGAKYGLSRGVRGERGSRKRHQSSTEYNRELQREKQRLEEENRKLAAESRSVAERIERLHNEEAAVLTRIEAIRRDEASEEDALRKKYAGEVEKLERELVEAKDRLIETETREQSAAAKYGAFMRRLDVKACSLHEPPQKTILGTYLTKDVDRYVAAVEAGSLMLQADSIAPEITIGQCEHKELERLREVEKEYRILADSKDALAARLKEIEIEELKWTYANELNRHLSTKVRVTSLEREGGYMLLKYSDFLCGKYAAIITPEREIYTTECPDQVPDLKAYFETAGKKPIWQLLHKPVSMSNEQPHNNERKMTRR